MRYKGADKSLPEIAEELGVDAVIEGSVLRAGDEVRALGEGLLEGAVEAQYVGHVVHDGAVQTQFIHHGPYVGHWFVKEGHAFTEND